MSAHKARVPRRLRERVAQTAGYCCGYCRTPERIVGFRLNIDPITGKRVRLWNPRCESWQDHFCWSDDGTGIVGLFPRGRATVRALRLNRPELVGARSLWVQAGWWPPRTESGS